MTHRRLLLASTAMAAVLAAPAPALAATRHSAQRAVVLQASGRVLRAVDSLHTVRSYTITGHMPAHVQPGSRISFIAHGAAVANVRVQGRTAQISYLARVRDVSSSAVTLELGSGATTTYRLYRRQAATTAHRLSRGSEALVTVALAVSGKQSVTVKRAVGAATSNERDVNGLITSLSAHTARTTVLTSSGIMLSLRLAKGVSASSAISDCASVEVYYQAQSHGLTATLVALNTRAATANCSRLHGGNGLVTAVAGNDRWVSVKTATGRTLRLNAGAGSLRKLVDRVSVTDYVDFTYAGAQLATLHDTSASKSGDVAAVSRSRHTMTVRIQGLGAIKLRTAHAHGLSGVRVGDSVDVDYYRSADGPFILVNCDNNGPARAGGNGGGSLDSGSGSGGAAGSGGDAGSATAAGAAGAGSAGAAGGAGGSSGAAGSAGSAGSSGATG